MVSKTGSNILNYVLDVGEMKEFSALRFCWQVSESIGIVIRTVWTQPTVENCKFMISFELFKCVGSVELQAIVLKYLQTLDNYREKRKVFATRVFDRKMVVD